MEANLNVILGVRKKEKERKPRPPTKEHLMKIEAKQLKRIEELGLIRIVEHREKGHDGRKTTGVALYDKKLWKETAYENRCTLKYTAGAHASCSFKDQFNKRLGRVIATARALQHLENYVP